MKFYCHLSQLLLDDGVFAKGYTIAFCYFGIFYYLIEYALVACYGGCHENPLVVECLGNIVPTLVQLSYHAALVNFCIVEEDFVQRVVEHGMKLSGGHTGGFHVDDEDADTPVFLGSIGVGSNPNPAIVSLTGK